MLAAHASYGGFYPAANPAWLQHTTTTHLCLVMEAMCICINRPCITYLSHYKGDYERTILHFEDSGCVVRMNSFSVVAKYYKGTGGIANRSQVSEYNAAVALARRFPQHISGIKMNKFGTSLRLRSLTERVGPTKTSKACEAAIKVKIRKHGGGAGRPWCPYCSSRGTVITKKSTRLGKWLCKSCCRIFTIAPYGSARRASSGWKR